MESQLHDAVKANNVEDVIALLDKNVDVNARDKAGWTPLLNAMELDDFYKYQHQKCDKKANSWLLRRIDIIHLLLKKDANVNLKNNAGYTPLHMATRYNRIEIVRLLLYRDANVNAQNNSGDTPLHLASIFGNSEIFSLLLEKFVDLNLKNSLEETVLHVATKYNNTEIIRLLLDKGVDVNLRDKYGKTSLHISSENNGTEIVFLLLKKDVDTNLQTESGDTALHEAIKSNNTEIVSLLLKQDADVNLSDGLGDTPIHIAVEVKHKEIVKLLLEKNVNVNLQNNSGDTPLHLAASHYNTEIVSLLLDKGVNVNLKNNLGDNPLHVAATNGRTEVVRSLLDTCVDVNAFNSLEETPLHIASWFKVIEIVRLLLLKGANVNSKNGFGNTPLHMAVMYDHTMEYDYNNDLECKLSNSSRKDMHWEVILIIMLLLLDSDDLEINLKNDTGDTPLHLVTKQISNGYHTIDSFKRLLNHGACFGEVNSDGFTPLCVLIEQESRERIKSNVQNHIILMLSAGLIVLESADLQLVYHEKWEKVREMFYEELTRIKTISVSGKIDLGIVFSCYRMPKYLSNTELVISIQEILNSPELESLFPNYAYLLKDTFKRSQRLFKLNNVAAQTLSTLLNQYLPEEIIYTIIYKLDEASKLQLIKCF